MMETMATLVCAHCVCLGRKFWWEFSSKPILLKSSKFYTIALDTDADYPFKKAKYMIRMTTSNARDLNSAKYKQFNTLSLPCSYKLLRRSKHVCKKSTWFLIETWLYFYVKNDLRWLVDGSTSLKYIAWLTMSMSCSCHYKRRLKYYMLRAIYRHLF